MTAPHRPVVLIPSRLQASRLPGKPLADINGSPMIVHVWRRAVECDLGPVVVACAQEEIADAVRSAGGEAVLTDPDLLTGSDRIHAALGIIDPESLHDAVVNIQGDLPVLDPHTVRAALALLETEGVDIGTVAAEITREEERDSPSVVKAVVAWQQDGRRGRALYFSRAEVPTGGGPLGATVSPHRSLRLPAHCSRAVCRPAPRRARTPRDARAAPRAGGRNADRRGPR